MLLHTYAGVAAYVSGRIIFGIIFPYVRIGKSYIGLVEDGIEPFGHLGLVVVECLKSYISKEHNGDDVDYRLETHGDVRKAPGHIQAVSGADKDHDGGADAENGHYRRAFGDEQNVGLRVKVVADDGCECKQADDHGDKVDPDGTDHARHALLQERNSRIAAVRPVAGQKDQENGRGTDQQSVDVDGNDLCKTLFCRV